MTVSWNDKALKRRAGRWVDRLLAEIGERAAARARELAPRDLDSLHDSIHATHDARNQVVRITALAPGAWLVELGTRDQAPRPFLRPAVTPIRQGNPE